MLRFGLLKYKKLNNAVFASGDPVPSEFSDDCGQQPSTARTMTTAAPVHRNHHLLIHNELSGSTMKNTNSRAINSPTESAKEHKLFQQAEPNDGGKKSSSTPELDRSSPKLRLSAVQSVLPSADNYKPLASSPTVTNPKRRTTTATTLTCKARIYKCIKRMLKRSNFSKEQKVHQPQQQQQHQQVRDKSKVDYREIKSLLEKEKPSLDYDVNLAKCVDKPALIRKIALNLMKSAEDEGRSLVITPEQLSETTSVQSNLDQKAEYQKLCNESWYHENLPRDLSLELLTNKTPGQFIVRKSTTQQDCYALSLRVPPPGPKIAHYLIVRTANDGYQIKGFHKEFTSLRALIVHHSVMPESLPVPLDVPRPANLAVKTKCEDDYDTVFDLPETISA
ncbi:uncharacterized protein LOC131429535 [Malaya genurostris]|uniref:uncharacterized protein LOC131429535 n=1 Tax=Malaya genurostris TaxID=325434 RepID=UPI0026F3ADBA|nr:uncharacterized protein LOC131429535 [Malaya genurostris]